MVAHSINIFIPTVSPYKKIKPCVAGVSTEIFVPHLEIKTTIFGPLMSIM